MLHVPSFITTLWDQYQVPENIRKHSIVVTKVAMKIAQKLKNQGLALDSDLVYTASMLHDIAKARCLRQDKKHAIEGARILKQEGYPKIAKIVAKHGLDAILEKNGLDSLEAKIVYYADKRVNHDQVVGLSERLRYIKDRYQHKRLEKNSVLASKIYELEKEILGMGSHDKFLKVIIE
ncbi:MAG: HD domain-containing protein [Candidatus Jacksonbacteria bacterium]